jgi:hypothetical protein
MKRDATRPAWPAWYGIAALLMALFATVVVSGMLLGILQALGADVDSDSSGVTLVSTLIQDIALAGSAVVLAAQIARPAAWQFGLRSLSIKQGLKWGAIAFAI